VRWGLPSTGAADSRPRQRPAMRWPLSRFAVAEQSMEPALGPGDWLLVWRGFRRGSPPRVRAGQIVIARHPGRTDMLLVKRLVREQSGGWWLGSDNQDARAVDSRSFGPVTRAAIEGRLLLRYHRGSRD
jgi:nickel-type superoxide dismutase maturation protease